MKHPDAVAQLLRPRSTWRDSSERGSRDHDALDWQDAILALGGCPPLAYAAFAWIHNADRASRRQLEAHLLGLIGELSNGVTPAMLVELALDEQHAPAAQRKDTLRALVLGIDPDAWRRRYQAVHARLLSELDSLAGDAWRCILRRSGDAA